MVLSTLNSAGLALAALVKPNADDPSMLIARIIFFMWNVPL